MKKIMLSAVLLVNIMLFAQEEQPHDQQATNQQLQDLMAKLERKLQNLDIKISALEQKVSDLDALVVADSIKMLNIGEQAALRTTSIYVSGEQNTKNPLQVYSDSPIKLGADWKYEINMSPFSLSITNGQVVNLGDERTRTIRVDVYVGPEHFVGEPHENGKFLVKRELGVMEPLTSFGGIALNTLLHELPSGTYYIDIILLQQREDGKWQVMDVHPLSKKLTI